MNRKQKEESVNQLRSQLEDANLVVITKTNGLTVAESTELRAQMREENAEFKVIKNTLAALSVKNTKLSDLEKFFVGTTAIAFSKDPIAAAKVSVNFSEKNEKLQITAGIMDGSFLNAKDVIALAKIPSKDELRAKIIGLLIAPATKIVRTIKEPAAQIARILVAKSNN